MHTKVFNKVFSQDNELTKLLSGGTKTVIAEGLKRQYEELLACFINNEELMSFFEGDKPLYIQNISKLLDLFIAAITNAESSQGGHGGLLSSAQLINGFDGFYQRLVKLIAPENLRRFISLALLHAKGIIGERKYIICTQSSDVIMTHLELKEEKSNYIKNIDVMAKTISEEMVQINSNRQWKINSSKLELCLKNFLSLWLKNDVEEPLMHEVSYCNFFIKELLVNINAEANFWELLLLKLERALILCSYAVSSATEALLVSVDRFDFIDLLWNRYQQYLNPLAPLDTLIFVRLILDAKSDSVLAQRWMQSINLEGIAQLGINQEQLHSVGQDLIEALREECERVQLDWLNLAIQYFKNIIRSCQETPELIKRLSPEFESFVTKIAEGTTDASGGKRLLLQLSGIFLECHYATLLTLDKIAAKGRVRQRLVCYLMHERDAVIWKKYKQISLTLSQIDIVEHSTLLNITQVRPLLQEVDAIFADQFRIALAWWPNELGLSSFAHNSHGCRESDLVLLLTQLAVYKKLHGLRSINQLVKWLGDWLVLDQKPTSYSQLRKTIASVHDALAVYPTLSDLTKILGQLLTRLCECTASKNIPLAVESIVENTMVCGMSHFATVLREHPEWMPSGGNERAWKLSVVDNRWLLLRLSSIYRSGFSEPASVLSWWWSVGVGKYIRRLPRQLISANLDALSQALFDDLSSDEALAVLNLIKSLYRTSFGIDADINQGSPAVFVPSLMQGKIWRQVFTCSNMKGLMFSHHHKTIAKAAPPLLEIVASNVPMLLAQCGDEEYIWRRLLPNFYALIEVNGTYAVERSWCEWQRNISQRLPTGAATFWLMVLARGLETVRQIGLSYQLKKHSEQVREYMAVRIADERIQIQEAAGLRSNQLSTLLRHVMLSLMSQVPTLAALNIARYLVMEANEKFSFSTKTWRLLWLGLDESLRPHLDSSESQALDCWTSQCLSLCDFLPAIKAFTKEILTNEQMVFADSYDEEMLWREAVSGIIAAALTPNAAPYTGQLVTQRLVLSCSLFHKETPATWNEKRLSLERAYEMIKQPILRGRLSDRHSQIATSLFNRERLLESGDLEPTHQYSLMMSAAPWAKTIWSFASLSRQMDEGRTGASYDDSIIANITRDVPPNSTLVATMKEQMRVAFGYQVGTELIRKKWLSQQTLVLTPEQSLCLNQLVQLTPLQDVLPALLIRQQVAQALAFGFSGAKSDSVIEYVALFFEGIKKQPLATQLSILAIERMQEHCINIICSERMLRQRINITKAIKLEHGSEQKTEFIEMCMAHWAVFMRSYHADMEHRRAGEILKAEVFHQDWTAARENMSLVIQQLLKQVSPSEQKMLNDFSISALSGHEVTV